MPAYYYDCPFCNRPCTVNDSNVATDQFTFEKGSRHGEQTVTLKAVSCPNPACREYSLTAALYDREPDPSPTTHSRTKLKIPAKRSWKLIPPSSAKVLPGYVPRPIIEDYEEACAIQELSPKASATLARRCLQGMIRDYWGVSRDRLVDEIEAIKDKTDALTWKAIDSVRKVGNIGAHMEKDINVIVDVEPEEAGLLIRLIETLVTDWYVAKHDREEHLKQIVAVAEAKGAQKKGGGQTKVGTESAS